MVKACELSRGGELVVGLTSDEMVKSKAHKVSDYRSRYDQVMQFIREQGIDPVIIKLDDPYGPTIHDDFDYLIASPETQPTAQDINRIRREKGMRPIRIVPVDYVLAEDGLPISATRISRGEIDEHGRIMKKCL